MSLPTTRLTITVAEYRLLKQGLDVLACGLAEIKLGGFPHRHPWHGVDFVASDVYRDQQRDEEMCDRIIRVRAKLWELTESRKILADVVELSVLGLALRVTRARKLVDNTDAVSAEIRMLGSKIERYRKRAKRAVIAKAAGSLEYKSIADRWRRNLAWLRYNTLYANTKIPNNLGPRRARFWREQRQQTAQLIKTILEENFYEALDDKQMTKVVTLLTTTLRRCRRAVGLVDFLRDPHAHSDLLIKFVVKRIELNRLPDAPKPAWQTASDRGDKLREYQEKVRGETAPPTEAIPERIIAAEQVPQVADPPKVKAPRPCTHNRVPLTIEVLCDVMAGRLYETVTAKFNFTREVCEQAQFQIKFGLLEQYRVKTVSTSLNGLVKEFYPAAVDFAGDALTVMNNYAGWLLGILMALPLSPQSMYTVVGAIYARAMRLDKEARHDQLLSRTSSGSQREPLSA